MLNAFSIDVEDYHSIVERDFLGRRARPTIRVEQNLYRLLALLEEHHVKATLFWLGEVVDQFPHLLRDAARQGHELGVHGYFHRKIFQIDIGTFREEVHRTKALIEDLTGVGVIGHRAPAFSITPKCDWAFDVLLDEGFRYDSSIFPFRGRRYGWPDVPLDPYPLMRHSGVLLEIPLPVVELAGRRVPVAGGGYLRLLPCRWTIWAVSKINRKRPAVLYIHPYEIETMPYQHARIRGDWHRWMRFVRFDTIRRLNRRTVLSTLDRLLSTFAFAPISTVFAESIDKRALLKKRDPRMR